MTMRKKEIGRVANDAARMFFDFDEVIAINTEADERVNLTEYARGARDALEAVHLMCGGEVTFSEGEQAFNALLAFRLSELGDELDKDGGKR